MGSLPMTALSISSGRTVCSRPPRAVRFTPLDAGRARRVRFAPAPLPLRAVVRRAVDLPRLAALPARARPTLREAPPLRAAAPRPLLAAFLVEADLLLVAIALSPHAAPYLERSRRDACIACAPDTGCASCFSPPRRE